jgi:hypothetical protein
VLVASYAEYLGAADVYTEYIHWLDTMTRNSQRNVVTYHAFLLRAT